MGCHFLLQGIFPTQGSNPHIQGFPAGSAGKESACNAGDLGSIPGLEISPGEVKGYPLQYSGLENSMNSSWGIVHGVTKSQTQLSDFHFGVLAGVEDKEVNELSRDSATEPSA